jgi:hypothetical protein
MRYRVGQVKKARAQAPSGEIATARKLRLISPTGRCQVSMSCEWHQKESQCIEEDEILEEPQVHGVEATEDFAPE